MADEAGASIWLLEDAEALRRRQARGLWHAQAEGKACKTTAVCARWLLECIKSWQYLQVEQYALSVSTPPKHNSGGELEVLGHKKQQKKQDADGKATRINGGKTAEGPRPSVTVESDACQPQSRQADKQPKQPAYQENQWKHSEVTDPLLCNEGPSKTITSCNTALPNQQRKEQHEEDQELQAEQQQQQKYGSAPIGEQPYRHLRPPKKRSTGKRLQTAEGVRREGGVRSKKKIRAPVTGEATGGEVPPLKSDDVSARGCGAASTEGDEQHNKQGTAGVSALPHGDVEKETPGAERCSRAENAVEDMLPASPATSDWAAPEASGTASEGIAADDTSAADEPDAHLVAASPADTVNESSGVPPRACATGTSHSATAMEFHQPAREQIEIAGLFEPEEDRDGAGYNFDFGEQSSLAPEHSETCNKVQCTGTQLEPTSRLHMDENMPCINGHSP